MFCSCAACGFCSTSFHCVSYKESASPFLVLLQVLILGCFIAVIQVLALDLVLALVHALGPVLVLVLIFISCFVSVFSFDSVS